MPSQEDTKTSKPSPIKSHHVPAPPPEKGPKRPRLFSCNRVEFQKKDADYERLQAIRQLYTARGIPRDTQGGGVQFVTKVQIKKTKTPVPSSRCDKTRDNDDDAASSAESIKEDDAVENDNQIVGIANTTKSSTDDKKIADLLWSDPSTDDTDVFKLVRTLSQKLNQNRLLLHRKRQDRPTASFAAPTKGEINLLLKSPEAKKAIQAKKCNGHQILMFSRGRALSLPVSNYFAVDKRPYRIPLGVVRPSTATEQVQNQPGIW